VFADHTIGYAAGRVARAGGTASLFTLQLSFAARPKTHPAPFLSHPAKFAAVLAGFLRPELAGTGANSPHER